MATRRTFLTSMAGVFVAPAIVRGQSAWPSQPIKLVVPFPPGGSTDILARVIGQKIETALGKPVVVENRAGAGGAPAATAVARSAPDGHTLMMGHIGTLVFNPLLYPNIAYDPIKDFRTVARVASVPNLLAVHPSVPVATTAELIAYIKANPGKLNYGSGGNGSNAHVSMAYFASSAGLDIVHVPYRGTAPAVNDLAGGHVQVMMTGGPALLPLGQAGKLKLLGVSSQQRVPFAADLPPIAEQLPGFESVQWYGIVGPAGVPNEIVKQLNTLVNQHLAARDVVETLTKDGAIAAPASPDDFAKQIAEDLVTWRRVISKANIRI